MVSPFIDHGTLSEYLQDHPTIDRRRLVSTVTHLAVRKGRLRFTIHQLYETSQAVAYLHKSGVIHGDIKATNILVSNELKALLCDFGLTKLATSRTSTALRSAGSLRWQAPELWDANTPKTYSSDVYAFGMTIAEVWACHEPPALR